MAARPLNRNQVRALGFLPLAFFTAQAIHYLQINQLGHMLWMCNIGNLLFALALFFESAMLIRVAVLWTVPGVAVWLVYVVPTWGMLFTGRFSWTELLGVISSSLAHVGGFAVGLVVLRRIGMDGRAWSNAFGWYLIVQLLSSLITPVAMNVNLSQSILSGWEQTFNSYLRFWLTLSILVGLCLWILGKLLSTIWPAASSPASDLPRA